MTINIILAVLIFGLALVYAVSGKTKAWLVITWLALAAWFLVRMGASFNPVGNF